MVEMYRTMVKIRLFEGRLPELYATGFTGLTHLYIGQEAVAAGVCANLRREDYILVPFWKSYTFPMRRL